MIARQDTGTAYATPEYVSTVVGSDSWVVCNVMSAKRVRKLLEKYAVVISRRDFELIQNRYRCNYTVEACRHSVFG